MDRGKWHSTEQPRTETFNLISRSKFRASSHRYLKTSSGRVGLKLSKTEKEDVVLLELLHFLGVVPSVLDLTDVGTAEHELAVRL
mmetsp:Transcript_16422/g.35723  ORF Transcript_16422/g.35723 Transcript_16422/m.35723 type:complete len:85 (-) Transcript_16422:11-265(-)